MTTLEFLAQNLTRKTEAQPHKAGMIHAGATEGDAGEGAGASFGTLLNALSAKEGGPDILLRANSAAPGGKDPRADQRASTEKHPNLITDPGLPLADASSSGPEGYAEALVQGIIPLLVQSQQASTVYATPSAATYGSGPEGNIGKGQGSSAREGQGIEGISSLKVSVLHQEAHFKPVLGNNLPQNPHQRADETSPGNHFASLVAGSGDEADGASRTHPDAEQAVSNTRVSSSAVKSSGIDLGTSTGETLFQQLTSAIAKEAINSSAQQEQDVVGVSPTSTNIVLKPSENALRVLNVQLHPVELGVVTVKMRLSGDQIEMELHAHNEETADLLRKDAEKLSGLLRTSGYRADIVTVHTMRTEMLQQENAARGNDSWASQPQSGGSQQGQAGQHGSARQSSVDMDELKHRVRGNGESERAAEGHSGGIYL